MEYHEWEVSHLFIFFFWIAWQLEETAVLTPNAFLARMELTPSTVGDFTGISPDFLFLLYFLLRSGFISPGCYESKLLVSRQPGDS